MARSSRRRARAWDRAIALGQSHGFRNAQATVIAPTGTIGLVMDCDTTGIEPDFALVKFKKLAGGGYFKIINQAVPAGAAHARLPRERDRRDRRLRRRPRLARRRRRRSTTTTLKAKGFDDEAIAKIEAALGSAFDIKFVFNRWTLGEDFLTETLKVPADTPQRPGLRPAHRTSASPRRTSRPPTSMCAGR